MTRHRPLPPQLAARPFVTAEALSHGVDAHRLAAPDLWRPFRGVCVPAGLGRSHAVRCWAASVLLGPGTVIAEISALLAMGRELPRGIDAAHLHVIAPRRTAQSRRAGLVLHQGGPGVYEPLGNRDHPVVRGYPFLVQHPAEAWALVAARVSDRAAIVLGDTLMRFEDVIASPAHLTQLLPSLAGRRGAARVRRCLPHLKTGTQSVMETEMRLVITGAGFACPVVNEDIYIDGRFVARPDLAYPHWRVAIEYDGDQHRSSPQQWRRDIQRRERLRRHGWHIVTAVAPDILADPRDFLARLAGVIPAAEITLPAR